ncbi:hypothetical protein F4774DRAFT_393959 [Daldinia eschscholtzii]|nr:hypothetical protein F4774DRAFT_393959 [Daldinia eschscholtzii]
MFRFPSAVESVHSDHSPHQTDNGADLRKSLYRRKGRIGIFLFSGWQSYDTTGFSEGVLLDIVLEIFFFVLISCLIRERLAHTKPLSSRTYYLQQHMFIIFPQIFRPRPSTG